MTSIIQPPRVPPTATGPQHLLTELPTYAAAERLVDTLSDRGFPVEHCRVVGTGLRTVGGSIALRAGWMALAGYLAHRATVGRRDFGSASSLEAGAYAVYVDAAYAGQAIRLAGLF